MTEDSDGTQDTDGIQQDETQQGAESFRRASSLQVLLIEDNPGDARLFEELLEESTVGTTFRHEETLDGGLSALREDRPDVLAIDLGLPDSEGTETVRTAASAGPPVPIVVLTGRDNLEVALQAQKAGAAEYLQKDELTPGLLGRTLRWAVERTRMRDKLRQRDAWIRSITEGVSVGVFRIGPTGRIQYTNEALARMLGVSGSEELVGEDLTAFYADSTQQGRMLAEEGAEGAEVTLERQDGSELVGLLSAEASYRESGEVLHYDGTLTEITRRKETEARLRVLSEAVEQVGDKVFVTDRQGRIQYVNEAFEAITGYTEKEVIGETPAVLQSGEQDEAFYKELWETILSGKTLRAEFVNEKKDGTQYVEDQTISPVTGEEGELTHFVSSGRDITDRKEREETLRRQRNLLQQTQRLAGGWEVDLRSEDLSWSDEVYRIHEVEPGTEIEVGDGIEFFAPDAQPKIRGAFERCVEKGEPYDLELPLDTANGNRRWVRTVGAPSETADGEIVKVAGAVQDITERKRAEARRKQMIERVTDAIVEVDDQWRFTLVNEQAEALYDLEEEELLGKDFWEVFAEARGTRFEDKYRSVMQTREPTRFEEYYSGLDGWFDIQVYPNDDGGVAFYFEEITGRKEQEEELRETNRLLEKTLESLSEAILVVDPPKREIIDCNSAVEEIFGYEPQELIGRSTEVLHVDEDAYERFGRVGEPELEEKGRFVTDYRMQRKDGTVIDTENVVTPLKGDEWPGGVVSAIRDITDRKKREWELAQQKALLEAQAEATIDGLLAVSEDRNVAFYNDRFLEIWDIPESAIEQNPTGNPLDKVLLGHVTGLLEDPEEFRQKIENLYDHPGKKSRDLVQLSDGRWLDRYSAPIVGGSGNHYGRLWVFRDVTERERRERELETISARLQLALESTDTGVFDWDLKTDEVVWDETSERLFGFEPDGFSGYGDWVERLHPADLAHTEEKIEEAIETGTTFEAEYRIRLPDGEERWIRARGTVEYEDGEPTRMIGIYTDVTERRNREERLREAKKEAEEASRLKSVMLANMSHEIRTPLTAINGFTEILTEELSGELAKMAERAHRGGERLMKTLNSVLDLSQIEAGTYDLNREQIHLQQTVEGTVQLLMSQAEDKGVSLTTAHQADPVGTWDNAALNRICQNLIGNAIKFTPEEGQVMVRVREEEEEALLEVEDTGIGISEAALPEIFEAFKQESEGLSREYEGAGLGLSIVRRLTEAMDGTIEVETEKGTGTCFTVRFPKRPERNEETS